MATLVNALSPNPDSTVLVIPKKPRPQNISAGQLRSHVTLFQQRLASIGIQPQFAVSIALPNSYEFVVSFLAVSWQRAIAAPLNPAYRQDEFEFFIGDLKSSLLLVPKGSYDEDGPAIKAAHGHGAAIAEVWFDAGQVTLELKDPGPLLDQGPQPAVHTPQPHDIALVLHTSGTTGRPKAVPLSHRNLTRTMRNITATYLLSSNDRTLLVMPLFHVHGLLAGLLAPLFSGGSVILASRFSASQFWDDFVSCKANWYTGVPTIHQVLLRSPPPQPLPAIRFIRSCSSPLSPKTFHDLEKTFDAPVLEAYAMTEGAHQIASNPLPPAKRIPGCVGVGQGVEIEILDQHGKTMPTSAEGEICIKGENVTAGYLGNPEANSQAFTQQGFFRTGDQGKKDAEGYVFITGRIKELINKGGEKISPVEIDNIVTRHPAVSEAVSFAIPDEHYGQNVGLAVVLKSEHSLSEEALRQWMGTKVAAFKLPKKVYYADVMPKTATGKIQRRMVSAAMTERDSRSAKL